MRVEEQSCSTPRRRAYDQITTPSLLVVPTKSKCELPFTALIQEQNSCKINEDEFGISKVLEPNAIFQKHIRSDSTIPIPVNADFLDKRQEMGLLKEHLNHSTSVVNSFDAKLEGHDDARLRIYETRLDDYMSRLSGCETQMSAYASELKALHEKFKMYDALISKDMGTVSQPLSALVQPLTTSSEIILPLTALATTLNEPICPVTLEQIPQHIRCGDQPLAARAVHL